jgi:predicted pyridoxine 5'-phosphate oxidase superfamily flavin-nucleotide-binding protein
MSYHNLTFTPNVRKTQIANSSPVARFELDGDLAPVPLGPTERRFIEASDGFVIASVSETGWPYVQFRGGPAGFARALDESTIAWAELRGNQQYITMGNLAGNDKIALFILDSARRQRLKLLGRGRLIDDPVILKALTPYADAGPVERAFVVTVAAYDWNCPEHITPRYTAAEIGSEVEWLRNRVAELEAQLQTVTRSV